AVVLEKKEEHEVSPATSKGAGLVPAPTSQCALLSRVQPAVDFLPFSWRHSQRWHRTPRHAALVSQDDAHIFLEKGKPPWIATRHDISSSGPRAEFSESPYRCVIKNTLQLGITGFIALLMEDGLKAAAYKVPGRVCGFALRTHICIHMDRHHTCCNTPQDSVLRMVYCTHAHIHIHTHAHMHIYTLPFRLLLFDRLSP
ncbi:hypothetical protein LEMLEM_LOCUS13845, partial [Lemmus lemmus]